MPSRIRSRLAAATVPLLALACLPGPARSWAPEQVHGIALIEKPQRQAFSSGNCITVTDGTLIGGWTGHDGSFLSFTIGPTASGLADAIPRSLARYEGPGKYQDVLLKYSLRGGLNLVLGLGTVTVESGGKHGRFEFNNGTAAGSWDCGRDAEERNRDVVAQNADRKLTGSSSGSYWDKRLLDGLKGGRYFPEIARMAEHILGLDRAGASYLSCQYGPPGQGLGPLYFWKDRVMASSAESAAITRSHKLLELGDRAYRQCPATYGEAMREKHRLKAEAQAVVDRLYPRKR